MLHSMNLNASPFERIKSGKKIIEIRLFDEKRQLLNLGDIINFSRLPDSEELTVQVLTVKVTGLLHYQTFVDLVNDLPMVYFGYPEDSDRDSFIKSIYNIYTSEQEEKYGVLGIKIKLI